MLSMASAARVTGMDPDNAVRSLAEVALPNSLLQTVSDRAQDIDSGTDTVRDLFPVLADACLVDLGAPCNANGELVHQAAVLHDLAERSLSVAFALWGHRMTIEYLTLTGGSFAEPLLQLLRAGTVPGVSAMAPGFKNFVGAGDLGLSLQRDARGRLLLSGRLDWASNLYSDAVVVASANGPNQNTDISGARQKVIVAFRVDAPEVTVGPDLNLLALRGTASTFVEIEDLVLAEEQILTDHFETFIRQARPTLSILQASFCLGLATASYRQVSQNVTGVNEVFNPQVDSLGDQLAKTKQQLAELARRVATGSVLRPQQLLSTRLEAGSLATELTTLELKTAGGKGYVTTSDTNRRYREASFIPIQAPSEAQLKWELDRT